MHDLLKENGRVVLGDLMVIYDREQVWKSVGEAARYLAKIEEKSEEKNRRCTFQKSPRYL